VGRYEEGLGVDGKIIFKKKLIFKKRDGQACPGLIWLRKWTSNGPSEMR
jgi:hypothetical protein